MAAFVLLDWPIYMFSTQLTFPFSRVEPPPPTHTPPIEKKTMFSPLAESTYRHQANIDDEVVTMEILDTAGQVRETILESFVINILG